MRKKMRGGVREWKCVWKCVLGLEIGGVQLLGFVCLPLDAASHVSITLSDATKPHTCV